MAHTKAGGTSKNLRDSNPKYLGVKRADGQSVAVGEIIVGILLGPSLFGLLAPDLFQYVFHSTPAAPMQMLSQIGLVLLMFQIGLEFDFAHLTARNNRRARIVCDSRLDVERLCRA